MIVGIIIAIVVIIIIAVIGITCWGILFYRNIKENHKRYKEFKIKS